MDIETKRKISRSMKGKSNFEGKRHTHATKIQIGISQEGHRNVKDHKWVTDKETGQEQRVKGRLPKGTRWGRSPSSFSENFMDGKNPENKGDMARKGLKGKSISQLKKVRSSTTATPRQKQLAHWYINMHKEETVNIVMRARDRMQMINSTEVNEDLRDWFKEKWVRMDTKGKIKGPCAKEPGEGKPKCLPLAKARAMDKKDRASAARRKRREDPNPDRQGAPINVRTEACWDGYVTKGMKKKGNRMVPNCVPEQVKTVTEAARVARKAGQPANSKQHSDLYTDENPKGTITGLKFTTADDAKTSVNRIKSSDRSHAHKIQAAVAMEQRARVMGKASAAAVYRSYINNMKEKTKDMKSEAKEYKDDSAHRLQGTSSLAKIYKKDTPGQTTKTLKEQNDGGYENWKNEEPVKYAKHLETFFGKPKELTNNRAIWYDVDGFKRVEVLDEYIMHASPAPHYDFVYCYIDLKVPTNLANKLAESSESITIDFLKNEVGARCASLAANAVTLNYVLEVVENRIQPSREAYEKRILDMKAMFKDGKRFELDWWPDVTKDTDPKNPYYKLTEACNHSKEDHMINEKNVPTQPEKWARAKAAAKQKFDVYPSAYANGWAAKKYKAMGGGWKSVAEASDVPFEGPYTTAKPNVTDKSGAVHTPMSRARNLARMALVSKKKKEQVKEATVDVADIEKKKAITPSDKNTIGKLADLMKKEKEKKQVNEVSKRTLGRYIEKAASSMSTAAFGQGQASASLRPPAEKDVKTGFKRMVGIARATSKLAKEEVEPAKMSNVTERVCALLRKK